MSINTTMGLMSALKQYQQKLRTPSVQQAQPQYAYRDKLFPTNPIPQSIGEFFDRQLPSALQSSPQPKPIGNADARNEALPNSPAYGNTTNVTGAQTASPIPPSAVAPGAATIPFPTPGAAAMSAVGFGTMNAEAGRAAAPSREQMALQGALADRISATRDKWRSALGSQPAEPLTPRQQLDDAQSAEVVRQQQAVGKMSAGDQYSNEQASAMGYQPGAGINPAAARNDGANADFRSTPGGEQMMDRFGPRSALGASAGSPADPNTIMAARPYGEDPMQIQRRMTEEQAMDQPGAVTRQGALGQAYTSRRIAARDAFEKSGGKMDADGNPVVGTGDKAALQLYQDEMAKTAQGVANQNARIEARREANGGLSDREIRRVRQRDSVLSRGVREGIISGEEKNARMDAMVSGAGGIASKIRARSALAGQQQGGARTDVAGTGIVMPNGLPDPMTQRAAQDRLESMFSQNMPDPTASQDERDAYNNGAVVQSFGLTPEMDPMAAQEKVLRPLSDADYRNRLMTNEQSRVATITALQEYARNMGQSNESWPNSTVEDRKFWSELLALDPNNANLTMRWLDKLAENYGTGGGMKSSLAKFYYGF